MARYLSDVTSFLDQARVWSHRVRCCRPPPAVEGLTTASGGGSGEVLVTWDPLPASANVAFYRVYEGKGVGTFWLLAIVTDAALGALEPGRLGIVDAPDYVVTAVSTRGLEGPMSAPACGSPP